jgi:hypothetical protein
MPMSQFPKRLAVFLGGSKSNVIWIIRQINFARGHSKINVLWILYYRKNILFLFLTGKHLVSLPFYFLLIRLSLVRITFWWWNHMKILILSGTFIFQIYFLRNIMSSSRRSKYIDFTVKIP